MDGDRVCDRNGFLFLKDATFNRKRYAELFKMNEQQIMLFESLQDREGLYMRRDGLTKVVTLNLDARSYSGVPGREWHPLVRGLHPAGQQRG
jgi:hypothetical protein